MKIESNTVTLSTGKVFMATQLTPLNRADLDVRWEERPEPFFDPSEFTDGERDEIGAYMIARWATWMGALRVTVVPRGRIDEIDVTIGFSPRVQNPGAPT